MKMSLSCVLAICVDKLWDRKHLRREIIDSTRVLHGRSLPATKSSCTCKVGEK